VFTYFFLNGLEGETDQGRDGLITLDETHRYVAKKMPVATSNGQHPAKKGTFGGSLVLGKIN